MNISKQIPLKTIFNTRDLGGITTRDHGLIRPRMLLRSGELYQLNRADKDRLVNDYRLTRIVDFRTEQEREQKPDPVLTHVTNTPLPVLSQAAWGITREKPGRQTGPKQQRAQFDEIARDPESYMIRLYGTIITSEHSQQQYRHFFQLLTGPGDGALLWHCSMGKDRAGLASALLLYSLGVSLDDIMADYLATNTYLQEQNTLTLEQLHARYPDDPALAEVSAKFLTANEDYLAEAFYKMEALSGSIDRYLSECLGVTAAQRQALRTLYLQ